MVVRYGRDLTWEEGGRRFRWGQGSSDRGTVEDSLGLESIIMDRVEQTIRYKT